MRFTRTVLLDNHKIINDCKKGLTVIPVLNYVSYYYNSI